MNNKSLLKIGLGLGVGLVAGKLMYDYSQLNKKQKVRVLYKNWAWFYDSFLSPWNYFLANGAEKDLHDYLKKNMKKSLDILDVACGTGVNYARTKKLKLKVNSYTGIDLSPDMLSRAKEKATEDKKTKFMIADLFKLEPKKKFDLIYATWTFSHFKKPSEIVKKYLKFLKKGGKMVVIFQARPSRFKLISNITDAIMGFFEAKLVQESEIRKIQKNAVVSKKYVSGYIRMMVLER
ncbi:class I SAM-dependent DNA methyltransferase [Patescibacteria group bacterium]